MSKAAAAIDIAPAAGGSPRPAGGVPTAVSADLMQLPSERMSRLMLSLVALVVAFVVWAALAAITEVTSGRGRVIPASKIQVVQNLEGGIVREIRVREGDHVREGDVLARIDPTLAGSSLGEAREKMQGLVALIARLEAEVEEKPLTFPQSVLDGRPDLAGHQREHFEARRKELDAALGALTLQETQRSQEVVETRSKIATLQRSLVLAREELDLVRGLERTRAASRSELITMEAKTNDIDGALKAAQLALPRLEAAVAEIADRRKEKLSSFRGDALQKLAAARVELAAIEQSSRGSEDKVARTTVRAPVAGIIKTVNVTTAGQVVQPGHSLIEIVPMNDTLLVEAQVRPQDVAFLRPGQEAKVKLTAYDPSIYGALAARLEQIGADSITTEKGETYYLVRVRTEKSHLEYRGETLPILPGMVADVDVVTGAKSVLTYITKPFVRMRDVALRER
jgi:adhesin transport system membrane fusion protein